MKKCVLLLVMLAVATFVEAAPRRKAVRNSRISPLRLENKLVFTRGEWATEVVWTMNPDGSGQKRIWRVPKGYGQFGGFNRDGTQALSYNRFNLYLHDFKTRRLRRLFVHSSGWGTFVDYPSFSRDGKRVIFAAGSGASGFLNSRIFVIDPQNPPRTMTEMQKLRVDKPANTSGDMYEPRFSADGKLFTVSIGLRFNEYPETFTGTWNIWTVNTDGSASHRVTSNPDASKGLIFDKAPCFSPDGQTIAFVRRVFHTRKGESNDIWFVDATGRNERRITAYEESAKHADAKEFKNRDYNTIADLHFNSNGKQMAFNQTGRATGIYRIDVDGRNSKRLTDGRLVQWVW